ncbi:hypothetical protein BDQ17DRAFT_1333659 [Cyathus striatus]|nr:hypothetical protein BDQ17DRAFT_1333659 [Cyathus striatus]
MSIVQIVFKLKQTTTRRNNFRPLHHSGVDRVLEEDEREREPFWTWETRLGVRLVGYIVNPTPGPARLQPPSLVPYTYNVLGPTFPSRGEMIRGIWKGWSTRDCGRAEPVGGDEREFRCKHVSTNAFSVAARSNWTLVLDICVRRAREVVVFLSTRFLKVQVVAMEVEEVAAGVLRYVYPSS